MSLGSKEGKRGVEKFPISGKEKRAKGMKGREMMKRKDTRVTILYDSAQHKQI
jgi:hypothetical protein